jgi:hypothetical protein
MAETSRTPDPDLPVPQGGGAAERLREFLAAREEPAADEPVPEESLAEEPPAEETDDDPPAR